MHDGSNPFFDSQILPKFHVKQRGLHNGHVQIGIQDPFFLVKNWKRKMHGKLWFPIIYIPSLSFNYA